MKNTRSKIIQQYELKNRIKKDLEYSQSHLSERISKFSDVLYSDLILIFTNHLLDFYYTEAMETLINSFDQKDSIIWNGYWFQKASNVKHNEICIRYEKSTEIKDSFTIYCRKRILIYSFLERKYKYYHLMKKYFLIKLLLK